MSAAEADELSRLADLAEAALGPQEAGLTVTELQGAACGVLAGGGSVNDLVTLLGEDALRDTDSVNAFWQASGELALDPELRFSPLLPEDEAPLAERVEALAQWCASFLAGFTRLRGTTGLGEETTEIVRDLAAIAGANTDMEDTNANEEDFIELAEFARVAILLLLAELTKGEADAEENPH